MFDWRRSCSELTQYREYANECRRFAATVKNSEHKRQLLEMAAAWDTVADSKVRACKNDFGRTLDRGADI